MATITLSGVAVFSLSLIDGLQDQNKSLLKQTCLLQNSNQILQSKISQLQENSSNVEKLQSQNDELRKQILSLQNQTNQLKEQNSYLQALRITKFAITGANTNANVGVLWAPIFSITVSNSQPANVSGATLTFTIISNSSLNRTLLFPVQYSYGLPYGPELRVGDTFRLGVLKQGENQMDGEILNDLADSARIKHSTLIVTLRIGDLIVDEASISL
jgi:hypothetical protein